MWASKLFLMVAQAFALESATLAGGCFWCVEADLEKVPGVVSVTSGFSGGDLANPSYKEVAKGKTRHLESVRVVFDPKKISYGQLLERFWRSIDPTDSKGQFVDRGHQYSSAIFYHNQKQKRVALGSRKRLQAAKRYGRPVVTPIRPFKAFYPAEEYHQDYYKKNPLRYKFYRHRSGRDQFLKKVWR